MVHPSTADRTARRICLQGKVQGHGVRPAIARLAMDCCLAGSVANTLTGLEIVIEGHVRDLQRVGERLIEALPAGCNVRDIQTEMIDRAEQTEFSLLRESKDGPLLAQVPPDLAMCKTCEQELSELSDRRHNYLLISCAGCGPRYSAIRAMPYERSDTSLAGFPLCRPCNEEYRSPGNRRFHAQTMACPECGPQVWAEDRQGRLVAAGEAALPVAVSALRRGDTVALCGVGGYQLLCDATNDDAISRLRTRKGRPDKPLAVLVNSIEVAEQLAFLSEGARAALTSPANPIVLVQSRPGSLANRSIHPGLNVIGLLLPTTALHYQITHTVGVPLVCTSANREGDPLEYDQRTAASRLRVLADLFVHHNRPIERPLDDSVVRVVKNRTQVIRLARGLAPLALDLKLETPTLALGGQMKAAAAWSNGVQSVLGPHVGEMESLESQDRFSSQCQTWQELYRFMPQRILHDLHPDYFTTHLAGRYVDRANINSRTAAPSNSGVPHHHAHAAAAMLEHNLLEETALCVTWDGTGLGIDGTMWGGDFLLCQGVQKFQRVAQLRPFRLAGGDAVSREPWRSACAIICQTLEREHLASHWDQVGIDPKLANPLCEILDRARLCIISSSAGRLFDAAACITLGITHATYEGQAATLLESVAERHDHGTYSLRLEGKTGCQLDWRPWFAGLWRDRLAGVSPGVMAARFHRTLASAIVAVSERFRGYPLLLAGGVFQNCLLQELVVELFPARNGRLFLPGAIPVNDGGLAAGQLALATVCPDSNKLFS